MKPRYVDISPYEDCRIVLRPGDPGFRVETLPTADVEPVKRGKWEMRSNTVRKWGMIYDETNFYCTCCDKPTLPNVRLRERYHYCPNCGAKMDEDRTDEQENANELQMH